MLDFYMRVYMHVCTAFARNSATAAALFEGEQYFVQFHTTYTYCPADAWSLTYFGSPPPHRAAASDIPQCSSRHMRPAVPECLLSASNTYIRAAAAYIQQMLSPWSHRQRRAVMIMCQRVEFLLLVRHAYVA